METRLLRYHEVISCCFWGAATVLVNLCLYFLCRRALPPLASNAIAWAGAVLFAFAVNKWFVFQRKTGGFAIVVAELWRFVLARLFSGGVETLLLWVFVTRLHRREDLVKASAEVLVIVMNYVLSKWMVFQKKDGLPPS